MKPFVDVVSLVGYAPIAYRLVRVHEVEGKSCRLDASNYAVTVAESTESLEGLLARHATEDLGTQSRVFGFGPFKRIYIDSSAHGTPMLTSGDMMEWEPNPAIMSNVDCPKWTQYQVRRGWILISCSGTIGNVGVVPQHWDGWAVSQDAIRVVPDRDMLGVVWAFLLLSTVKALLVRRKSGSVVDHIYEDDVARIPLPIVSRRMRQTLSSRFEDCLGLREAACGLVAQSLEQVCTVNGLPECRLDNQRTAPDTFAVTSGNVLRDESSCRLDAHFYNPTAQLAISSIRKCPSVIKTVGEVALKVLMGPRFKRNYVEADHGVPFLSGKSIAQIRPTDLKYLSNLQMVDMQDLVVEQGWTLITCSGTVGRTCFVWKNYEGYAASQDILRVVPDECEIDPGYLYAFLSSPYGYQQILRYRHGSVIDHITSKQVAQVLVPCPPRDQQRAIGDMVRDAYEKRAEAIRHEDAAQAILMQELKNASGSEEG